jgi:dTDP-4-amino-4,6-dideoxygalactose transaminase
MNKVPLIKPYISEEIKKKVLDVLDSGYLTEGPVTHEFEEVMKAHIGCSHAVAVCNCTVGLELGLRVMGVGPGDEVIIPDYTYPATGDVVAIVGANTVIVDIDPDTGLMDYDALEEAITPNTKVIIPVSLFGNPLDYDRLSVVKMKYNISILEDAACSIGSKYDGVSVGNLADMSVFSLHPRKFITTGEGGVVTTNSTLWFEWINSYKHFGMAENTTRAGTQFVRIGSNYKLSNIQAAIGLVQARHMELLLNKRKELSARYLELLKDIEGIAFPKTTPKGDHSRQSFVVCVENRDKIIAALKEKGIESQIGSYSLHRHKAFNENPHCRIVGDMSGSAYAFEHYLCLPLYHEMTEDIQDYVVQALANVLKETLSAHK